MKIILASHYFSPHIGGIESVVESHAKRLANRGHEVIVVCSDIDAESMDIMRDGYRVHRYKAWNPAEKLGAPYPIPNPVNARKRIVEIFTNSKIDIVHVHGMNYLTTTAILRYTPIECPVVLHQHTPFVEYPVPFELIEKANDRTVGLWNLRQADHVFCVSRNVRQYVSRIDHSLNPEILVNGINTDEYHPDNGTKQDVFDCDPDTPVLFSLSRLSEKKGLSVLLDALRILDRRGQEVHVVIAGDGPMRSVVEMAANTLDCLEFYGKVTDSKLKRYYAAADGFLFTSKSGEAFPTLTIMEACASGTPVIASKLSEKAPGMTDGENCVLVEPGDADELVEGIVECANNPKKVAIMSQKARESAEQHFAIESRIDRLEECYRSVSGTVESKSSSS
ncbi:glycosyltransferase family 4 protein [Saliphagus infecundisoli]|uniref:Glycosyltransferase family 4 protein n=1 Tax=Saliphagus infecundisoli TaxID=1849069 RepID=A0ABD5QGS7_9EURY|nr:glycosyltransferase family 4 protein [Saliphagus infecundisoli]